MERYCIINGVPFLRKVAGWVDEFKALFPTTTTMELAAHFGSTHSTMAHLAKALGLKKSPEYNLRNSMANLEKAHYKQKITNNYQTQNLLLHQRRFTRDDNWWKNATDEQKKAVRKKIGDRRKADYIAERRRINWGLPQKTNIKVSFQSGEKRSARARLRANGYREAGNGRWIVPEKRHPMQEAFMIERYGFKFLEDEERNID